MTPPHSYLLCQQLDCIKEWGGQGPGRRAVVLFLGTQSLPGPLCVGCSDVPWSHASLLQRFLPFSRWFPARAQPTAVSQTSGPASTLRPHPDLRLRLRLCSPRLAQPGLLSTPRLDWGLRPCRRHTDHVAFVVLSSSLSPPNQAACWVRTGLCHLAFPGSGIGPGIQYEKASSMWLICIC